MNRSTPPPPQGDRRYLIPPLLLRGAIDFHTSWLPPEELYAEAQDRGLWQDRTTRDALTCRSLTACRPLLSLRKGHLTRLIPAGLLNNQVLVQGTAHWIIKGRAKKQTRELPPITEEVQTKDGPETRTIFRSLERFTCEARAWNVTPGPDYGEYIIIDEGVPDHEGTAVPSPERDRSPDEFEQLIEGLKLKPGYRVYRCAGLAGAVRTEHDQHRLPLYARNGPSMRARQFACPDMIIVHTVTSTVVVIIEFETDTGPKNLTGNFFAPFPTYEYRDPNSRQVFYMDRNLTTHVLIACVDRPGQTLRDQAAVQKGQLLAAWLEQAMQPLLADPTLGSLRAAIPLIGDDWGGYQNSN